MKRAFTLIELMVVVGIMAFLGVAATGGYSALQRGMAERGAVDAAVTLLQAAKERALVDRSPTMVFCYNRLVREATEEENAVVVGEAVAIRRAGRISWVRGDRLVDEFMDVVGSYDIADGASTDKGQGMKLWYFGESKPSSMEYSIVAEEVAPIDSVQLTSFDDWVDGGANTADPYNVRDMHNIVYSFIKLSGGTSPNWAPGSGYGFEFAHVQLPNNFTFERNVPQQAGQLVLAKTMYFDPENSSGDIQDESVDVYVCVPNASGMPNADHKAGTASSKANKDQVL